MRYGTVTGLRGNNADVDNRYWLVEDRDDQAITLCAAPDPQRGLDRMWVKELLAGDAVIYKRTNSSDRRPGEFIGQLLVRSKPVSRSTLIDRYRMKGKHHGFLVFERRGQIGAIAESKLQTLWEVLERHPDLLKDGEHPCEIG